MLGGALACAGAASALRQTYAAGSQLRPDWQSLFAKAGTTGVVCLAPGGTIVTSDVARADIGVIPASTFKIANALIAFETGVVTSPDERFEWDGTVRGHNGIPIAAWNKSQTFREGFANSTVWIYQEVARRIGHERMAHHVQAFDYGNADISGVPVDQFWLTGRLRISPVQQIAFIERVWGGRVPVKPQLVDTVKDMMVIERIGDVTLHGKTGWQGDVGWFVGAFAKADQITPFALTMTLDGSAEMAKSRFSIVKTAARDLGLLS